MLRLPELQENNVDAKKIQLKDLLKNWEDVESVLQYYGLPYILNILHIKLINHHHNDLLGDHFGIDKTYKVVVR